MPEREGRTEQERLDLMDIVWEQGVNVILEALYRYLDRPSRPRISVDGWQEVLTHLVVLAAASPDWLRRAREEEKQGGLVAAARGLQPLSAAVLISGLFDVAIRLEGSKPTGYISLGRGRGSKGHAAEDRFHDLTTYLQNEYRKYLSPETDAPGRTGHQGDAAFGSRAEQPAVCVSPSRRCLGSVDQRPAGRPVDRITGAGYGAARVGPVLAVGEEHLRPAEKATASALRRPTTG